MVQVLLRLSAVLASRWLIIALSLIIGMTALIWLSTLSPMGLPPAELAPGALGPRSPSSAPNAMRIGLIPERDIFEQRRRYQVLAKYLAGQLGRPVELVTATSYDAIVRDFHDKQVDAAFLGSLVAVLSVDRMDARILVKPELPDGVCTYRGVIFVSERSGIRSIADLAGKSIAMVRTTTGGDLFPVYQLVQNRMFASASSPKIIWVGTHDDVILEVLAGRADAGALKDLRLDDFERAHPGARFRRLASSESVPENALVVRADIAEQLGPVLCDLLLKMDRSTEGREALAGFGAARFVPCRIEEYRAIYDMTDAIAGVWDRSGIDGARPVRPASLQVQTTQP